MFGLGSVIVPANLLSAFGRPPFVAQLASLALGELVFAALASAAAIAYAGGRPSLVESLRAARDRFGTILELLARQLGAFLLLAITLVGIPLALRIFVRWFFGTQGVMLRGLNAKDAISHSCQLVTGRWWPIAGIILLAVLIFGGPAFASTFVFDYRLTIVIWMPFSVVVTPILSCFWTLAFFDLEGTRKATVVTSPSMP
jgi:hypothetical protein